MKNIKQIYAIGFVLLLAVVVFVYFAANPGKITGKTEKNNCDERFLQWCAVHSNGVDYDNFAFENKDCIGRGSYRTCEQVSEALS